MLSILISRIYRALFLRGDDLELKHAHMHVKLIFLITGLISIYTGSYITSITVIILGLLLSLYYDFSKEYCSALVIALIPALWLALTNLLIVAVVKGTLSIHALTIVFLKVIAATLIILLFMIMLSPIELCNIIVKLGRGNPIYPLMTWRFIPLGLKEVEESYIIQRLKGEAIWKSLAIASASMIERGDRIIEANIHKLNLKLRKLLPYLYYLRPTIILSLCTILLIFIAFLEVKVLPFLSIIH